MEQLFEPSALTGFNDENASLQTIRPAKITKGEGSGAYFVTGDVTTSNGKCFRNPMLQPSKISDSGKKILDGLAQAKNPSLFLIQENGDVQELPASPSQSAASLLYPSKFSSEAPAAAGRKSLKEGAHITDDVLAARLDGMENYNQQNPPRQPVSFIMPSISEALCGDFVGRESDGNESKLFFQKMRRDLPDMSSYILHPGDTLFLTPRKFIKKDENGQDIDGPYRDAKTGAFPYYDVSVFTHQDKFMIYRQMMSEITSAKGLLEKSAGSIAFLPINHNDPSRPDYQPHWTCATIDSKDSIRFLNSLKQDYASYAQSSLQNFFKRRDGDQPFILPRKECENGDQNKKLLDDLFGDNNFIYLQPYRSDASVLSYPEKKPVLDKDGSQRRIRLSDDANPVAKAALNAFLKLTNLDFYQEQDTPKQKNLADCCLFVDAAACALQKACHEGGKPDFKNMPVPTRKGLKGYMHSSNVFTQGENDIDQDDISHRYAPGSFITPFGDVLRLKNSRGATLKSDAPVQVVKEGEHMFHILGTVQMDDMEWPGASFTSGQLSAQGRAFLENAASSQKTTALRIDRNGNAQENKNRLSFLMPRR